MSVFLIEIHVVHFLQTITMNYEVRNAAESFISHSFLSCKLTMREYL